MPAPCFRVPIVNPPGAACSLQVAIVYDCQSAKVQPHDGITFNHATFHAEMCLRDLYFSPCMEVEEFYHSVEVVKSRPAVKPDFFLESFYRNKGSSIQKRIMKAQP